MQKSCSVLPIPEFPAHPAFHGVLTLVDEVHQHLVCVSIRLRTGEVTYPAGLVQVWLT